jgi:AcrR family transcriptional regulator
MGNPVPPRNKTSQEAILKVAEGLAEAEGLRGVGVRAIASQLGISPGTIYNVVGDVDDVIVLVNAQTLQRLQNVLRGEILPEREAMLNVFAIADAYVGFVLGNVKHWSMLLEHSLASDKSLPDWYRNELDQTIELVDCALKPLIRAKKERQRCVAALWASLQGIASLAASGKLSMVNQDDPRDLARLLIGRFFGVSPPRQTKPALASQSKKRNNKADVTRHS